MKKQKIFVCVTLAAPMLFPPAAWAAPQDGTDGRAGPMYDSFLQLMPIGNLVDAMSLDQLADMVVTESKVAQPQETVTQKITVLRVDDFEQQTVYNRNIAELMRYTSGQFVNVLSRNDANWGSYAGLGPKYNSYLLDGLPIDSFADAMSLDSWAFERVEAHKGPASVMYSNYLTMDFAGNEAPLAGITNFILKDRVEAPMTRMRAGLGSYNTYNARIYHQGRQGNLSYLLGGNYEQSDYTQYGLPNSGLQTVKSPEYDKLKLYGKMSYALGRDDHRLSLFLHHTDHEGDQGRPNRDYAHRYDTLNLAYDNQLTEALRLQVKAGQRDYERRFGSDSYPASLNLRKHSETKQRILPVDLTMSYAHGGNGLLTAGMDSQWAHYRTGTESPTGVITHDNDASARSTGVFLQEKWQFADWVLRGGVRHNSIQHEYDLLGGKVPAMTEASWSKLLWSLGARYNASPRLSFYGNSGSSFMAPAAKQVGGTVSSSGDSGQLPSPGLKPENGIGTDLGVDWRPTEALALGLRVFHNSIENAIVDNVVSTVPSQTQSVNAGTATAHGVELDIKHAFSNNLQWFGNLTYTQTKVTSQNNADQDGTAIPFSPDHVANLGLTSQLPWGVTLSPYYHWVGRYYDSTSRSGRKPFGHYGVLNVRLQKSLKRDADYALNLTVDLNNLTDKRYDMPWDFRDPGFNAFAGLHLVF